MLPYYPALRFKQGEYVACARIAADIRRHVFPRFVLPPLAEPDPESGRQLTPDEVAHVTSSRIGKHWGQWPAFLDPQNVLPQLDDAGVVALFSQSQKRNPLLVPVVSLSAIFNPIYRGLLGVNQPKIGVYMSYDEVDVDALVAGLGEIGCSPKACVVFIDFTGTDLNPELASGTVAAIFDQFVDAGPWGRVVFQGSSFPLVNPGVVNKTITVKRDEWETFHAAIAETVLDIDQIGYGDFGADHGQIKFPKSGRAQAIRHLRYTTPTSVTVVRGSAEGQQSREMKRVCRSLIESPAFAGRGFSYADEQIWKVAKGLRSAGTASNWREWNMAHHMTQVVRDLGSIFDVTFEDQPVFEFAEQQTLFRWNDDD